jgi:hypothetical protein
MIESVSAIRNVDSRGARRIEKRYDKMIRLIT